MVRNCRNITTNHKESNREFQEILQLSVKNEGKNLEDVIFNTKQFSLLSKIVCIFSMKNRTICTFYCIMLYY